MTFPRHIASAVFPIVLAAVLAVVLAAAPARAASQREEFRAALHEFKALLDSPSKAKYRDNWLRVHDLFQDVHNIDSSSIYAAKSLYYMARVYQELGARSYLAKDHRRAVDAFQRAVNRFPPGHSWIDDCLYRKAEILAEHLNEPARAEAALRLLLRDFPKGDFAPRARTLLARLEGGGSAPKAPRAPKASVASAPKSAPAAAPASKKASASLRNDYQRAVNHFAAMRRSGKAYTREQWLDAYRRFSRVYTDDPVGEYAPKALYFMGYVYDELGVRSGSTADFQRAVGYYERAARLFPADSTWIDDALMRKAVVSYKRLNDEDQAYADLLQVTRHYPHGDQVAEAKDMLRAMDQARVKDLPTPERADETPRSAPARAASATAGSSGMAQLTDVRHRSTDDYTRIVLDLDSPAGYQDHRLPADPKHQKSHRMYIDVDGARVGPAVRPDIKMAGGFLRSVRVGQYDPDTARVVLDFEKPQKYHVFTLENPYRIVVDVYADSGQQDMALASPGTSQAARAGAAEKQAPAGPPSKATQQAAKDILAQLGMTVRTILIDAGHGGHDPGAVRRETRGGKKRIVAMEKDVTLRAAKVLGRTLEKRGFKVMYTRTDDTYVSLEDRSVLGNIKKADMFISLHCNANNSSRVSGLETYYLSKASNEKVLRLAAYENGVDPVRISDTQKIVMDLVYGFKIEESKTLAAYVQKRCLGNLRAHYSKVNDHGARGAPFFVLIGAKMPAILVEMGYISNSTEAKRLESGKYLQRVADGIADGVEAYRKELIVAGR